MRLSFAPFCRQAYCLLDQNRTFIDQKAFEGLCHRCRSLGFSMHDGSEHIAADVRASDDYAATGPQDRVILAMKAHLVEAVARDVPKLFGLDTLAVTMQNGISYWCFHQQGGRYRAHRCAALTRTVSS